jgi:hypothetical protein
MRGCHRALIGSCAIAAALLCQLLVVGIGWSSASASAATPPPALAALELKMSELKITSERFALQTSVAVPHVSGKVEQLLKLLGVDSKTTGEVTFAPSAANVTLSLFGQPFTVRGVGEVEYVDFPSLGRVDHGRPWVNLGQAGLAGLFSVNGHAPTSEPIEPPTSEPKLAEPPFQGIANTLAGAREVREVGPGTVDGQPVRSFLATLEPSQLKSKALAAGARRRPASKPAKGTLEVSLTEAGLPLRTIVVVHDSRATVTATLEIPAVNFPLVIEAPPAAQTIELAALHKLERQEAARKRRKRRAAKHRR